MNTQIPNRDLKQFISAIANKNYSEANKHLQQTVENKLKTRIKQSLQQKN